MSITIELERDGRKAGNVCHRDYRKGPGCPLIVRQTSEDLMTANVFGILRHVRPSLWLRPFLSQAFGMPRFSTCSLKGLQFFFWTPVRPPAARAFTEGYTEVDLLIKTAQFCVLVEAKYRAPLSTKTAHDPDRDQVIRLLDVAYEMTSADVLFSRQPFMLVLGAARAEPSLVTRYRDPSQVSEALKHRRRFSDGERISQQLAKHLGYFSWPGLADVLRSHLHRANRAETPFLGDVIRYIKAKMEALEVTRSALRQLHLPVADNHDSQGRPHK
jgi:hypothetical protein